MEAGYHPQSGFRFHVDLNSAPCIEEYQSDEAAEDSRRCSSIRIVDRIRFWHQDLCKEIMGTGYASAWRGQGAYGATEGGRDRTGLLRRSCPASECRA